MQAIRAMRGVTVTLVLQAQKETQAQQVTLETQVITVLGGWVEQVELGAMQAIQVALARVVEEEVVVVVLGAVGFLV
jgi:hypothetical protein